MSVTTCCKNVNVLLSKAIVGCILTLSTFVVKAQDSDTDTQTWIDMVGFVSVSKRSAVGGDLGLRGLISNWDWNQYYVRPTYRFILSNKVDFGGGGAIFYTSNQELSDLMEYRIFEEVNLDWPSFDAFNISHRLRFEQRFFDYKNPIESYSGDDNFSARGRYQLAIESNDFILFDQIFYAIGAVEYFQINDSNSELFINNARLLAVLGHRVSLNFRYEIHYIYQKSRKYVEDGQSTSEHIIRLRIFRVPKLLKKIEQ